MPRLAYLVVGVGQWREDYKAPDKHQESSHERPLVRTLGHQRALSFLEEY